MFQMILMTALTFVPAPKQTAQFQPCVWPNKCFQQSAPRQVIAPVALTLAGEPKIKTCDWPNTCS